jgi:hypothetical protein
MVEKQARPQVLQDLMAGFNPTNNPQLSKQIASRVYPEFADLQPQVDPAIAGALQEFTANKTAPATAGDGVEGMFQGLKRYSTETSGGVLTPLIQNYVGQVEALKASKENILPRLKKLLFGERTTQP